MNTQKALAATAHWYTKLDVARSTHLRIMPIELQFLEEIHTAWSSETARRVRRGDHFLTPRALGQLLREILEHSAPSETLTCIGPESLGHLLLSISSEQHSEPGFAADVPNAEEIRALEFKMQNMNLDQTVEALKEMIPAEVASFLYDHTSKLEILQANTYNTWFSEWPIPVTDPCLGNCPADAFAIATGIDLRDVLRLGRIIEAFSRTGRVEWTRTELLHAGASTESIDLLARNMSLTIAEYRNRMTADRARGSVGHQRYTMTQYPCVSVDANTFLLLRHQWGIERFFGSHLYWETFGTFNTAGKRSSAKAFSQAMDFVFERQIGLTLERIALRSKRITSVLTEKQMQEEWTVRAGSPPSACDWALLGSKVSVVVDATNHSLNATLAQGMATLENYNDDVDRTFTDRKFIQLSATIGELKSRGWAGSEIGDQTDFIPLVVVPDTGLPNTTLTDYDLQRRSIPIFEQFQPHVFAPAVLTQGDLQLFEGIGDHYPGDVIELLGGWRHQCMRNPVPIRLNDFLDQFNIKRPLSKHILRSHIALLNLLDD